MINFRFVYFFFRLSERKRYQKERTPSALPGLLRTPSVLKGRNSLRSDSLPFLTAGSHPPLNAPPVRPESHPACWCNVIPSAVEGSHIQLCAT